MMVVAVSDEPVPPLQAAITEIKDAVKTYQTKVPDAGTVELPNKSLEEQSWKIKPICPEHLSLRWPCNQPSKKFP